MPRGGAAVPKATKPKAARGHKLPPPLPGGEIVRDIVKNDWQIGKAIGQGGFGQIYAASKDVDKPVSDKFKHVIKIEPKTNGPLFCEINFYQRVARSEYLSLYKETRLLKYVSVPEYIAHGLHTHSNLEYRFLVLPRLGTDLQALFEQHERRFSVHTVCALALRLLDALEFIHSHGYVHADVKASNILVGCDGGQIQPDRVYLVDYGLAFRYKVDEKHKEYKEDPKRAHDGTIEFTSRDAHLGVSPSCRGDLEILAYCLLQWLCSQLPWEHKLNDKNYVRDEKIRLMKNVPTLMMTCFPHRKYPECLEMYLTHVTALGYTETPDYDRLRDLFRQELTASNEWTLGLVTGVKTPQKSLRKTQQKAPQSQNRKRKSDMMNGDVRAAKVTTSDSDASPSPIKRPNESKANKDAARIKPSTSDSGQASTRRTAARKKPPARSVKTVDPPVRSPTDSTTDSDVSPSPIKRPPVRRQPGGGDSNRLAASASNHEIVPAAARVNSGVKKRGVTKREAAKSVLSKYVRDRALKLSPQSIIPGIRTSPRLSPRSIIPGAPRYVKPPLTSELPTAHTPAADNTPRNRRTVKRRKKRGVETAVQTSPMVQQ